MFRRKQKMTEQSDTIRSAVSAYQARLAEIEQQVRDERNRLVAEELNTLKAATGGSALAAWLVDNTLRDYPRETQELLDLLAEGTSVEDILEYGENRGWGYTFDAIAERARAAGAFEGLPATSDGGEAQPFTVIGVRAHGQTYAGAVVPGEVEVTNLGNVSGYNVFSQVVQASSAQRAARQVARSRG